MKRVLIVGATSAIAEATARRFAASGAAFHLVARDRVRLEEIAEALRGAGAGEVTTAGFEARAFDRHERLVEEAFTALGTVDVALVAHGYLPDQSECERDAARALDALNVDALSAVSVLTHLANRFQDQAIQDQVGGTIAVITSVAGDRGRPSNYVYGSGKALVSAFAQGLRARMHGHGVRVLTVKPGPVDTPMTAHREKGAFWSTPEAVGKGVHRAIVRGRDEVYVPGMWRPIMWAVRTIPERIFKRMSL